MLRKALIVDGGDTKFIQGDQVEYAELVEANKMAESNDKQPATFERVLLRNYKGSVAMQQIHLFLLHLSKKQQESLQKQLLLARKMV